MHWLYILRSNSTGKCYIGYTNNLRKRLTSHTSDKNLATKNRGPWKLIYLEGFVSELDALDREKKLKQFGQSYARLKRRLKHTFKAIG